LRNGQNDEYSLFWLGVLEAAERVDWDRDPVPFLITSGYGTINRERRKEERFQAVRVCPVCGKIFPSSCMYCYCGTETVRENLQQPLVWDDGDEIYGREENDLELFWDIENFVKTLKPDTKDSYVARRYFIERADLFYDNYLKQLGKEMGCSAAYAASVVRRLRAGLRSYLTR